MAVTLTADRSVLLLVDLQQRLMPAIAGGEAVVANVRRLAEAARLLGVPVVATEQNPAGLGGTIPALAPLPTRRLEKRFFDATREADFESFLPAGRPAIVVAGCEAHVCVMQTVAGLIDTGHAVKWVADAVGSRHPHDRLSATERARKMGADVVTTEMVIFEWLRTSEHPKFKQLLQLVR